MGAETLGENHAGTRGCKNEPVEPRKAKTISWTGDRARMNEEEGTGEKKLCGKQKLWGPGSWQGAVEEFGQRAALGRIIISISIITR